MQTASVSKVRESWTELTVRGFRDFAYGQTAEAACCWLKAGEGLPPHETFDPIYAASLSNSGTAHFLLGHLIEAKRYFAAADQAWQHAVDGIEAIDVPMTGASSSFHFRLAAKEASAFSSVRRDRYRRLAEAARAISQFNNALLDRQNATSRTLDERSAAFRENLRETLGERSPEVRLLTASAGPDIHAIYADKFAALKERHQTFAAALSEECAQLESAIALTALLSPSMFDKPRAGDDAIDNSNQAGPE